MIKKAIKLFLILFLLTGFFYPLAITFLAHLIFPNQAKGSLIIKDQKILGSSLIAQKFTSDLYFWPRPSAINYDPLGPSGGSNLSPTSKKLKSEVLARMEKFSLTDPVLNELVYSSASGLDPHISLEAALYQAPRIAKARNRDVEAILKLISKFKEGKQIGIFGPSYVNVLLLNLELDKNL